MVYHYIKKQFRKSGLISPYDIRAIKLVNQFKTNQFKPLKPLKKMEHKFITYIRTKMLFNERLRYIDDNSVFVHESDLQRFSVSVDTLHELIAKGELSHVNGRFKALKAGAVDMALIKRFGAPQTDLHKWLKKALMFVDLPKDSESTNYFDSFLKTRNLNLDLFFTVDRFANRVHTPVSSLHRTIRPHLLLCGEPTIEIDLAQAQPTFLSKVLLLNIGQNEFSSAIDAGVDVYELLQAKAKLKTRDEAKKVMFKMLFSKPSNELSLLFGDANFIKWINHYKSISEPRNPHGKEKKHSNLSWLLQTMEVDLFTDIWQEMARNGLPFVSVHDSIIVQNSALIQATDIMNNELSKHFTNYKINSK